MQTDMTFPLCILCFVCIQLIVKGKKLQDKANEELHTSEDVSITVLAIRKLYIIGEVYL
jgi:hypothetical protein